MSMPPADYQLSWVITFQTERDQVQAAGPPVRGVTIGYQTGQGHSGTVWVPYSTYNQGPDKVSPIIAAAAARMDQIGSLSSGG